MSNDTILTDAISNRPNVETVLLPASALNALLKEVRRQGDMIEHLLENQEMQATLIMKLKAMMSPEPSEAQADRATILKSLLAVRGGKMFAKDARQIMRVEKSSFSRLLATMKADIEVRPVHADRRRDLLILRSENG